MSRLSVVASSWFDRAASAVGRRARHWWRVATLGQRPPTAETALRRLMQRATAEGLAPTCGTSVACPGLTAAAIPTMWAYGETETALAWARRLARLQKPDGSLPDAGLLHPSLFNTAQAARAFALLEQSDALDEAKSSRLRACSFLASRIDEQGTVRVPSVGGSFERWAPATVRLAGLAMLLDSDPSRQAQSHREAARRAIELVLRTTDVVRHTTSLHVATHGIEALLDLAIIEPRAEHAAREFLESIASLQLRDGSVPVDGEQRWTSSSGLAHLAALWVRVGMKDAADRAVACLAEQQESTGGWRGSWGRGAAYFPNHESTWTAKHALDAIAARVATSFAAGPVDLVEPLAEGDGRLHAVMAAMETLPADGHVVDAGCGGGRYLAAIREHFPRLRLTGVDPSPILLNQAAKFGDAVLGNLLRLPLATERFDIAVCIEALEHALVPERAVDELCRVVRPGGQVIVIDKDRRFQGLSHHEPWERWFDRETVAGWLAKSCEQVTCTVLPLGPHQKTSGLFLCWQGVRRAGDVGAVPFRPAA